MPSRLPAFLLILVTLVFCACNQIAAAPTSMPTNTVSRTPSVTPPPTERRAITPYPTVSPASITPSPTGTTRTPSATLSAPQANVSHMPDPSQFSWELVADGFQQPLGIVAPPDGSARLFVLEQGGLIWILQDGERQELPFLDLRATVNVTGSTVHGLMGMAFDPGYAHNGYFYLHYTEKGRRSVIARYRVSGDANVGDPDSGTRLLEIEYNIGEHIGGDLSFGPDGLLYIPIGDGGGGGFNDADGNAQNPFTLPGSLLRLDVGQNLEPEVFAYGLRNPWRIAFDGLNGDLYIADVGENRSEEINFLEAGSPAGINFGWPYREGSQRYQGQPPEGLILTDPVAEYDHSLGCSVTGGQVYRGEALPEWYGIYLYGDFCQGNVWGLLRLADGSWANEKLFQLPGTFITAFGLDRDGEIYLVGYSGEIYRLDRLP